MTTINMNRDTTANSIGVMGRVKSYLSRSRAERQLKQLDDRMLSDIGVTRSEITTRVWGN